MKSSIKRAGAIALAASMMLSLAANSTVSAAESTGNKYMDIFNEQYDKLKDPNNGYFSPDGLPYHSIETIVAEAPDYGHESSSETISYYLWLEAMKGKFSGDFSGVTDAWDKIEKYYIPSHADQPSMAKYNASSPAMYAPEWEQVEKYPAVLDLSAPVGVDPIDSELKATYGTSDIYGMHWLLDLDNFFGFGKRNTGTGSPVLINNFQRGEQESTFEVITQPCWDDLKYGGKNGYLDLFTKDKSYAAQYKYTNAPDADARVVQATYNAYLWAKEQGKDLDPALVGKAAKLGDYLRYILYDKYFRKIGDSESAGTGKDSCHYLFSWYYAWGGDASKQASWSWKIGSSHLHQAYQNPLAAWILSTQSEFKPKSPTAATDWGKSLTRQIEFYNWLQSNEGAIAGGATNSWNGRYEPIPAGTSTFYGMGYQYNPVYHDPDSNQWLGFQAWPVQRLAEYYYYTPDPNLKALLTKWAAWMKKEIKFDDVKHTFVMPMTLGWEGQPDTWTGKRTENTKLHVIVKEYGLDLGVAGSLANTFAYIAKSGIDPSMQDVAKKMLDYMAQYKDDKGIAIKESRGDYKRFNDPIYVPAGWTGTMPNGDPIKQGSTFLSIRSNYLNDPDWPRVQAALDAGVAPEFTYHRFWAQTDLAIAYGTFAMLFPNDKPKIPDPLLGDVNDDKVVDALDFAKLKMYLLDSRKTVINMVNADINEDKDVNALDLAALKKMLLAPKTK